MPNRPAALYKIGNRTPYKAAANNGNHLYGTKPPARSTATAAVPPSDIATFPQM
jgi:hypothetical protein